MWGYGYGDMDMGIWIWGYGWTWMPGDVDLGDVNLGGSAGQDKRSTPAFNNPSLLNFEGHCKPFRGFVKHKTSVFIFT